MSQRAAGSGPGRRARPRRIGTGKLIAIAVGAAVICMASLTAVTELNRTSCTSGPVVVSVAASADIAPAVTTVAKAFNSQKVVSGGRCIDVKVAAGDPALQAAEIDGQRPLQGAAIDAWIPDSSLWADLARTFPVGAQTVQPTGQSVARSPLLLVTSAPVAQATHIFDIQPSWSVLLPPAYGGPPASLGIGVDLPDPASSAAGLAALIEVNRQIGDGTGARTALTEFALAASPRPNSDTPLALAQFAQTSLLRPAITVASEQAVLAYDKADLAVPIVARYPTGATSSLGTPELDYPFVLTTTGTRALRAAREFGSYLQSSYAQSVVRYAGFRSADGAPDTLPATAGLAPQPLQLAATPSPEVAAASLQDWQRLALGYRDLDLIDVSAAMNYPAGVGNQTLEQVLTQTAAKGLSLFPPTTQMGLWEMGDSNSASQPYQELMPIGELSSPWGVVTRETQLQQIISTLKAGGGKLALNDAILAGYREVTRTYAQGYANAVLVLTTGIDTAPGDISVSSLVTQLERLYNPSKKVDIIAIMFGNKGNFQGLQAAAKATGGAAYEVTNPAQIQQVFIEAVSQRMCNQECG